jgi:hypothetical protein
MASRSVVYRTCRRVDPPADSAAAQANPLDRTVTLRTTRRNEEADRSDRPIQWANNASLTALVRGIGALMHPFTSGMRKLIDRLRSPLLSGASHPVPGEVKRCSGSSTTDVGSRAPLPR